MKSRLGQAIRALMLLLGIFVGVALGQTPQRPPASVEFPGPQPGPGHGAQADGRLTLENNVIGAAWNLDDGTLRPVELTNKLTGERFVQAGAELFRLALKPPGCQPEGVVVGVRLEAQRVVALVSHDGRAWTEVGSYPRAEFPGEPKLVRLGKMNLRAQAKDSPGDAGVVGECVITEILPPAAAVPGGRWALQTAAHRASVREYPFPAGSTQVSCRIDKGTDKGMSWGPALALVWEDGQRFVLLGVREGQTVFNVTTAGGERITGAKLDTYPVMDLPASAFRVVGIPALTKLEPDPQGVRVTERMGGMALDCDLASARGLRAHWRAELRDGANYVRQILRLQAASAAGIPLWGVEFTDVRVPELKAIGVCPGVPVAGRGMFFGVEIPGSQHVLDPGGGRMGFGCKLELAPAQDYTFGAVAGVAPAGQLRRAFLCYVQRERARPSEPFVHYNCWYDLGYAVSAATMQDVVTRFDEELVQKRGVNVQSYLVDDGWDNPGKGLWIENEEKFPGGFKSLKTQLEPRGAHLGIWISPLGGYGGAKERTDHARKMGLIPPAGELDLACPAYKQWFENRCLQLMRADGVNAFKWDRAGDGVSPHFMALLDVAHNLRKENPKVFINVTVGTWPSPFWLNHIDATWRNGSADVGWTGKGDDREKWLTFRDGYCRANFVEKSPLYPLNSCMHHGIVHGRCFQGKKVGLTGPHLRHEARSYFANGSSLQELYITPSMMTAEAWDDLAAAAQWGQANAAVLADAHWVGGDPLRLQPYGYAAWCPRQGTLMVRNPDAAPQTITLDAATVFELPAGAAEHYALRSPYKDQRIQNVALQAGIPEAVRLEPFEVLVFDALPQ